MAKTQIHRGKVKIGDTVIRDPSYIIDAENDQVFYKSEQITFMEFVYIVMNKPKGLLSATEDKKQKTVLDIVPDKMKRKKLFPVGRLDKDTTGLLILTDDGTFAHRLTAPTKTVEKTYRVVLDGEIDNALIGKFKEGITLADGTLCQPAKLRIIDKQTAEITITEGKYHQIKRMFGVAGLGVVELERTSIGRFVLPKELDYGECRFLSEKEKEDLFR